MITTIYLTFIGILVSDIIYQSTLLQKLYTELNKIKIKIEHLEDKIK